jgi:hypothetical protein
MIMLIEIISFNQPNDYIEIDIKEYNINAKNKISELTGTYPKDQLWLINSKLLDKKIKLNKSDKIRIILNNEWIQISINYNNEIIKLPSMSSRNKIYEIKLLIFKIFKIIPPNINLIYNNIILEDEDFIGKYQIKNNSVLKLIPKINSGLK